MKVNQVLENDEYENMPIFDMQKYLQRKIESGLHVHRLYIKVFNEFLTDGKIKWTALRNNPHAITIDLFLDSPLELFPSRISQESYIPVKNLGLSQIQHIRNVAKKVNKTFDLIMLYQKKYQQQNYTNK